MNEFMLKQAEQQAYDMWICIWCETGSRPLLRDCPARYTKDADLRQAMIRGWNRAIDEYLDEQR